MSVHWRKMIVWAGVAVLALALAIAAMPVAPAHAAHGRATSADTLSIAPLNGSTVEYEANPSKDVEVTLTLGSPWPNHTVGPVVTVLMDGGQQYPLQLFDASNNNYVTWTGTFVAGPPDLPNYLAIGSYTFSATFADSITNTTVTSSTITITVTPIHKWLMCGSGDNGGNMNSMATWKPGQAVSIVIQNANLDGPVPIDWTKGTATITLKGSKTFTYTGLALNSNGATTITAPATVGRYAINCGVTGVPYYIFGDSGFGSAAYLVSQEHELGAVKLYTNPSTLVTGVPIQMYIVFVAAPGVPTPTGQFTVYIGSGSQFLYLRNGAYIGSGGTKTISFSPISNLYGAKSITINYFGDPYYKPQEWTFPMTNPAIPGSGGTTPSKPTATPKPHATATAGATPTAGAGSGATSGPPAQAPTPSAGPSVLGAFGPFSGGGLIALLVVVALLALGGGVGTFVLLSRRGAAPASPDYPAQWPARSPLDVDTAPNLDTTRPEAPPWWRQDGGPYDGQR